MILQARPLSWDLIGHLAPRINKDDAGECKVSNLDPLQALSTGAMVGPAWAVVRQDSGTPVGAFGFTPAGSIWSLWADLTMRESLEVLQGTPEWVHGMAAVHHQSVRGERLHNHVACSNKRALTWLRMSKCFWIDPTEVDVRGVPHHYFETLPLHLLEARANV